jgi:hypothetical protein
MLARTQSVLLSTVFAAGLIAGLSVTPAAAQDVVKRSPSEAGSGLNPQGGQINHGIALRPPSGSPPGMNDQSGPGETVADRAKPVETTSPTGEPFPTPAEARAAFHAPVFKDVLAGGAEVESAQAPSGADKEKVTGQGSLDPTGASAGHAAIGGAMSPGASAVTGGGGSGSSGGANTVGSAGTAQQQTAAAAPAGPQAKPQANGGDEPRLGPIGAVGESMPAKFSKRNHTLDRVPAMAWPLPVSEQERQKVFQAVMAEKGTASDLGKLGVTDQLPTQLALADMHPLPQSVAGISDLNTLYYVKGKDKVLLVRPAERIIVDAISNQAPS